MRHTRCRCSKTGVCVRWGCDCKCRNKHTPEIATDYDYLTITPLQRGAFVSGVLSRFPLLVFVKDLHGARPTSLFLRLRFHFLSSTFLWKKVEPKPLTAQGAFLCAGLSRMSPRLSPSQPTMPRIFGLLGFRHAPRAAGRQIGDRSNVGGKNKWTVTVIAP